MKELKIEFTNKEITPWGGMVLINKMLEKMDIKSVLKQCPLPSQGSNRGYNPEQLFLNFMVGVWCGANNIEQLEVTRQDEVIRQIFKWDKMPGHRSFQRFFNKFDHVKNQHVFTFLYQWFFSNLAFTNFTVDFDSTIITRYGEQQGAKRGYNPRKRGRKSHHPLMAFVADCRMIANFWLRPGDSGTTNNFLSFLEDTLEKLPGKEVGLLRADSGFYSHEIMTYLEKRWQKINYIIAVKFYMPIKRILASQRVWLKLGDGIEIAETTYQSPEWDQPRRIVLVRQEISKRPKAAGRQLKLFEDEYLYKNYRYSCFITNLTLPSRLVYDLYRGRADAENRIKEVKYDFGAESFNSNNFWATEAALNTVMIAYNIMSLFRQAVIGGKVQHFMKTIRYKVFAVGAYIVKDGNSTILKLSMEMKRREWFKGLWASSGMIHLPYEIQY